MAVCYRVLLKPSQQGAEAVAVGVPGWQDPSHGALGCVHLFQNHSRVLLQLFHLLTDVVVICSWGAKRKQSKSQTNDTPCVWKLSLFWSVLSNCSQKFCTVTFYQLGWMRKFNRPVTQSQNTYRGQICSSISQRPASVYDELLPTKRGAPVCSPAPVFKSIS